MNLSPPSRRVDPTTTNRPLRVALLTYRGKQHCGGQGVYVRELSRSLLNMGHRVEVFSGQPYPEVCEGIPLHKLPSLDIFNDHFPGRLPGFWEVKTLADWIEVNTFKLGAFPEPLAFSVRAWQTLRRKVNSFDLVHDNQSLGYGLLGLQCEGMPVIATIHHPITVDRRLEMAQAESFGERFAKSRWYSFTKMQTRVAQRLPLMITVSEASKRDICRDHGIDARRVKVVPVGVHPNVFRPLPSVRRETRLLVTTASADAAMKGLPVLLDALKQLRAARDVRLVVIGSLRPGSPTTRALAQPSLSGAVEVISGLPTSEIVELYARASVVVVPSLYEGFSLPAVEAMSCAAPLVATTGGALAEVVGNSALLVPPGNSEKLAAAIARVLNSERLALELGSEGRRRVLANWSWESTAERTVAAYRSLLSQRAATNGNPARPWPTAASNP